MHPIHVEAVTSVVGRGETLAAVLSLGFLLLCLRAVDGRRWRGLAFGLALVLYALANLTKESASVAPALLFLLLVWRAEGTLASRLRTALLRGLPAYAGSAAVLFGILRLRAAVLGGAIRAAATGIFEVENPLAPLPALARAANACAVFFRGLGRMALPLRLSADESAWSLRPLGPRDVLFWAAPALLAVLAAASRAPSHTLAFRSRLPLAVPRGPADFEPALSDGHDLRRSGWPTCPPSGLCLIAASWIAGGASELSALSRRRAASLAALALFWAARSVVRNPVWASDEALFTNLVRVSPDSAKAHYDFAYMSAENGRPRRALEHYVRAVEIYPGYWDAWAGKGRAERTLGDPAASEKSYAESLRLVPTYENGFFGLGLAREERGNREGAEEAYRTGLRHNPQSLPLAYRMALVLSAEGRPVALYAWRRALAIEPGSLPARLGYADWLARSGRRDEALAQVREVLRLAPRHAPALRKLKELEP